MQLGQNEIEFVEVNGVQKKFADTVAREAVDDLGEKVDNLVIPKFNNIGWKDISSQVEVLKQANGGVTVHAIKLNGWITLRLSAEYTFAKSVYTENAIRIKSNDYLIASGVMVDFAGIGYTEEASGDCICGHFSIKEGNLINFDEISYDGNFRVRTSVTYPAQNP